MYKMHACIYMLAIFYRYNIYNTYRDISVLCNCCCCTTIKIAFYGPANLLIPVSTYKLLITMVKS